MQATVIHPSPHEPYYGKQSGPVLLMFDISMRDTSPGDKGASLFIAGMYACGWKPYCMSLHNRSCRLLHSVTLSALVNSEPRLSRKIDFSALYPPYWRAATFGTRRYRQPVLYRHLISETWLIWAPQWLYLRRSSVFAVHMALALAHTV